ncbi:MAG: divergent polysaccharide deacetylase family protein [Pseudomonadota bacterium]
MARGFLSGIIWGGVVSVIGAGAVSVIANDPTTPEAGDTAPSETSAPLEGEGSDAREVRDADLAVDEAAPQVTLPEVDTVAAASEAGADTPQVPQTGTAEDLATPAESADAAGVAIDDVAPVAPSAVSDAPDAPEAETELSISTEPAQPAPPTVPDAPTAFAAEEAQAPETPAAEDPAPQTPAVAEAPAPADADTPAQPDVAAVAPEAPAQEPPVTTPEEASKEENAPDDVMAALPSTLDPAAAPRPSIGRPAATLIERTPEVPATDTATDDTPADTRAISLHAAAFENPDEKPLMAIVLMDAGVDLSGGTVGLAALNAFPYPLSFAVDATLPDAATRMADYRAQGFEVMALMDLPRGATAGDAEVALSAALDAVPEAVAVMEGPDSGLQDNRDTSEQVAQAVQDTGHGLVLHSKGLNTAHKLAVRDGVPAGLIFRDFDSADQTPSVIRRFLDQAAFRAGQEGGVIMVGRLRPDTISALLLWGLQDRAERVALAPISAVLTALVPPAE